MERLARASPGEIADLAEELAGLVAVLDEGTPEGASLLHAAPFDVSDEVESALPALAAAPAEVRAALPLVAAAYVGVAASPAPAQ